MITRLVNQQYDQKALRNTAQMLEVIMGLETGPSHTPVISERDQPPKGTAVSGSDAV